MESSENIYYDKINFNIYDEHGALKNLTSDATLNLSLDMETAFKISEGEILYEGFVSSDGDDAASILPKELKVDIEIKKKKERTKEKRSRLPSNKNNLSIKSAPSRTAVPKVVAGAKKQVKVPDVFYRLTAQNKAKNPPLKTAIIPDSVEKKPNFRAPAYRYLINHGRNLNYTETRTETTGMSKKPYVPKIRRPKSQPEVKTIKMSAVSRFSEIPSRPYYHYELPTISKLIKSKYPELFNPPCLCTTPVIYTE